MIFNRKRMSLLMLMILLSGLMLGGCGSPAAAPTPTPTPLTVLERSPFSADLASWEQNGPTARVAPYMVEDDFSNVVNRDQFEELLFGEQRLEADGLAHLQENAFVVAPGYGEEFFSIYEINRYGQIPNFVTTDAMLHNYHLFFSRLLKGVEKNHFIGDLTELNAHMLAAADQQYAELEGTTWENAARRNLAFFAVGSTLLVPGSNIPVAVQSEVEAELDLIRGQQGNEISPVMNMGAESDLLPLLLEDYSQYIPRGHYTSTTELEAYFQTMMWYGRMSFRQKSEDECRSALLITLALQPGQGAEQWQNIYDVSSFLVGESDDLSIYNYAPIIRDIYGEAPELEKLPQQTEEWQRFMNAVSELRPPALNSIPIFDDAILPDRETMIKAFRFMGQRYTLDASVFQRLVYREVGENAAGERRMLPSGLDIPAALGSDEALVLLVAEGAGGYTGYHENMDKMRSYIAAVDQNIWNMNLYWSWLNTLKPLLTVKGEGYPSFMQNQSWQHKELVTFLGSWAELKHDTILYAKQVYAEMGGGDITERDDRGYVEPNSELYARLAALSAATASGLKQRGLLDERDYVSLQRMEELALSLMTIADKELQEQDLTEEEYELIRSFGGQLEHFWLEALRDEKAGEEVYLKDYPAALITDVATNPEGEVLEVGTGFVDRIYVVVPVDGSLRLTVGAVYSYYEFAWPSQDRLTDEKWREIINIGYIGDPSAVVAEPPEMPDWVQSYRTKTIEIY